MSTQSHYEEVLKAFDHRCISMLLAFMLCDCYSRTTINTNEKREEKEEWIKNGTKPHSHMTSIDQLISIQYLQASQQIQLTHNNIKIDHNNRKMTRQTQKERANRSTKRTKIMMKIEPRQNKNTAVPAFFLFGRINFYAHDTTPLFWTDNIYLERSNTTKSAFVIDSHWKHLSTTKNIIKSKKKSKIELWIQQKKTTFIVAVENNKQKVCATHTFNITREKNLQHPFGISFSKEFEITLHADQWRGRYRSYEYDHSHAYRQFGEKHSVQDFEGEDKFKNKKRKRTHKYVEGESKIRAYISSIKLVRQ